MTPLFSDPALWTGVIVGAGAVGLPLGRKVSTHRARSRALQSQVTTAESAAAASRQQLAEAGEAIGRLHEEAEYLASVHLPALVAALQHGLADGDLPSEFLHPDVAASPTGQAFLVVRDHTRKLSIAASEQAEGSARVAVGAVTGSVMALVNELTLAITNLLNAEHDETLLARVQPIDHAASQLARRLQVVSALTDRWPGRQREDAPLLDVVRGAVSRVRDFPRVRVPYESAHYIAGRVVEPLVLALAEFLDNACRQSAPTTPVEVSILEGHNGLTIQVHDAGPGMSPEALEMAKHRLSGEHPVRLTELRNPPSFGLLGVGALAARYGFRADVDEQQSIHGGVRAVLFVPRMLLAAVPAPHQTATATAPRHRAHTAAAPAPLPPENHGFDVADDGLPMRRRHAAAPPGGPARPAAEPPSPDAGAALAAFMDGTRSARALSDEES
ncbi:ATP-binding protein [Streptomyces sp. NPDC046977]|uniref:ATP-binding protein n=1 Tax=Streptomyces sp. NPDC046977 TaxID=3154703 RepID=UPI0033E7B2EA